MAPRPNPLAVRRAAALAISGGLAVAGLIGASFTDVARHTGVPAVVIVGALVCLFALAEWTKVHIEVRRHALSVSLGDFPVIIGVFTVSPWLVLAANIAGTGVVQLARRLEGHKMAFNLGVGAMEVGIAGLICTLLTRDAGVAFWAAAIVAVFVVGLVGTAAVLTVISFLDARPTRMEMAGMAASVAASGLTCATLASWAVLGLTGGWSGMLLLTVASAAMFLAFRSYALLVRDRRDQGAVLDAARRMGEMEDEDGVYARLCESAARLAGAEISQVWLADSGEQLPWETARLVAHGTREPGEHQWLTQHAFRDALVVPVEFDGVRQGTLVVANRLARAGTFNTNDLNLVHTLVTHAVALLRNHTLSHRLLFEATHDPLTGLPNRAAFSTAVERVLLRRDTDDTLSAVLLVDLDRFKEINDILGHAAGDRVLSAVADRLARAVPDDAVLSRFGGDEFAVLLPSARDAREVEALATRLTAALEPPVRVADSVIDVAASVGIAGVFAPDIDPPTLIRHVDIAVSAAKARDASFAWYAARDDQAGHERLGLASQLRRAVEDDVIDVHFQPQVSVLDGRVVGFEALARWNPVGRGTVPPQEFIPLADQTGLITPLTKRVLTRALSECLRWPADVGVSVNVTARQLREPDLADRVARAMNEVGFPPERLTLELTEDSVMGAGQDDLTPLHRLRERGVRLAIDDFGTGYSSFAYLRSLPVHEVKIDKSFMPGVSGDPGALALVQSIVEVTHVLGLTSVAEGVEDDGTMFALRDVGCDIAQGYRIARPMPAREVAAWLREWGLAHAPGTAGSPAPTGR